MSDIGSIFEGGAFDANSQPAPTSFEPIPVGVYEFEIANAEVKNTKDGVGKYVKTELTVLGPTHENRKIFANFNLVNASEKAQEIGRQQFGAVCRAVGVPQIQDTAELIGGRFKCKVKIRPAQGEYQAQNEIQAETSEPMGGAATVATPRPGSAAAPAASKAAPWAKKAAA